MECNSIFFFLPHPYVLIPVPFQKDEMNNTCSNQNTKLCFSVACSPNVHLSNSYVLSQHPFKKTKWAANVHPAKTQNCATSQRVIKYRPSALIESIAPTLCYWLLQQRSHKTRPGLGQPPGGFPLCLPPRWTCHQCRLWPWSLDAGRPCSKRR